LVIAPFCADPGNADGGSRGPNRKNLSAEKRRAPQLANLMPLFNNSDYTEKLISSRLFSAWFSILVFPIPGDFLTELMKFFTSVQPIFHAKFRPAKKCNQPHGISRITRSAAQGGGLKLRLVCVSRAAGLPPRNFLISTD